MEKCALNNTVHQYWAWLYAWHSECFEG